VERVLFKVGDLVEKDTVIIKFPQNNLSANYFQAKAAYENSLETFRRIEQLYKSKGVSRQDYDNAKTAHDVSRANWDNVNKMVNVPAPIKGYITRLDVMATDNVKSGDHLFTIANYNKVTAKIKVQEKDIQKVKIGMNASAQWGGNVISGKITQIDLSLNPDTQAFGAFIEFDNKDRKIMSGVNAEISIFIYENNSTIIVDKKYLIEDAAGKYLYTVLDNLPVKKTVKTGWQSGEKIEIIQGINSGDILITEGSKIITDSSKIRIITGE
jgi:RND family efflux transporter MFP subunit